MIPCQRLGISAKHIGWLCELGAGQVKHSGRTLLAHLIGTHDLLRRWGQSSQLCRVGLFHSIYGTRTFAKRSLSVDERDTLVALTDNETERLVYGFAACDRQQWFEYIDQPFSQFDDQLAPGVLRLEQRQLHQLVIVEIANLAEQLPYRSSTSATTLQTWRAQCHLAQPLLPHAARLQLQELLLL